MSSSSSGLGDLHTGTVPGLDVKKPQSPSSLFRSHHLESSKLSVPMPTLILISSEALG